MHDEFRPPSAKLTEPGARPTRSSVAAVLLGGFVVDFFGTFLLAAVSGFVWGVGVALRGGGPDEARAALSSSEFRLVQNVLGTCLTFAGGYVAARYAGRRPIAHGIGAGLVSLALVLGLLALSPASERSWLAIAALAIHLPLAAAGGWLAARTTA